MNFKDDFTRIRNAVEELAAIPEVSEVWRIREDKEFWDTLNKIKEIGNNRDTSYATWLGNLTQLDDYGSMGRDLSLSKLAIAALSTMPKEAYNVAMQLHNNLSPNANNLQKMGVCLVFRASGLSSAIPILQKYLNNSNAVFRREVERMINELEDS